MNRREFLQVAGAFALGTIASSYSPPFSQAASLRDSHPDAFDTVEYNNGFKAHYCKSQDTWMAMRLRVRYGEINETPQELGRIHLLEHMIAKGYAKPFLGQATTGLTEVE